MIVATNIKTDLGTIEITADETGLREIILPGGSRKTLPGRHLSCDNHPVLSEAAQQITEFLAGERTAFSLPLSISGTPFQKQVWEIIRKIPFGRTLSYADIATRLGNRNKARAVGGAAHANPLPLVIPCHRVVGSTGKLTGFACGLPMKQKLLALEGILLPS